MLETKAHEDSCPILSVFSMNSLIIFLSGIIGLGGVSVLFAIKNARDGVETPEGLVLLESSNVTTGSRIPSTTDRVTLSAAAAKNVGLKSLTFS